MTLLSIIIIHHNDTNDAIDCLKQLKTQTFKDFKIIIVDNDSDNDSINILNSFLKRFQQDKKVKVDLHYQGINNGFSGGMNYGIKKSSGDIILIFNSDTIFDEYFLEKAIKFLNTHSNYSIMGPKIYYYPNKQKIWFTGAFFNFINYTGGKRLGRGMIDPDNKILKKIIEVDYISGCCMFIRRKVFEKIKLFDKNFFIYLEDSDFCYRAKKQQFKIVYFPTILLYHKIDEKREKLSDFMKYHYFKNKIFFIFKHYHSILILYHLLISILIIPISFIKNRIIYGKSLRIFFEIVKAVIEGIILGIKLKIS